MPDNGTAELAFFHSDYPLKADMDYFANLTRRQINYIDVNHYFFEFPKGIDPYLDEPTYYRDSKWGYHHMIYFWFRDVFHHPFLRDVKYLMRLDTDSGIISPWPNVFSEMANKKAVYFANQEDTEWAWVLPGQASTRSCRAALCSH